MNNENHTYTLSSGTCTIRRATLEDIDSIRRMADVVFRHTYRIILTPEQMEYMMEWMYSPESLRQQMTENGHIYYILTTPDEGDVGYVSFNEDPAAADAGSAEDSPKGSEAATADAEPERLFHLQKIYVLPTMQHRGFGAVLLHHVESEMRRVAGTAPARYELNVNRNNAAIGFYEHHGLRRLRQGDFHIGNGFYMNDYIMGREV